ncbi:hypothetical protein PLICRDRAFT_101505 [Plicaturopsis crispa FD-325 SS-3]|nr:hypothetical protein PLICRDRAFT_101505 [Plicaturopsis crispa FD-325 SS-3]
MSFGRPPSLNAGFSVAPPDRGSFPLDHDGECKSQMMLYLDCLRKNSSTSTACRVLSKEYLNCRMNNGLMDKDDWKNLGLANLDAKDTSAATTPHTGDADTKPPDKP